MQISQGSITSAARLQSKSESKADRCGPRKGFFLAAADQWTRCQLAMKFSILQGPSKSLFFGAGQWKINVQNYGLNGDFHNQAMSYEWSADSVDLSEKQSNTLFQGLLFTITDTT